MASRRDPDHAAAIYIATDRAERALALFLDAEDDAQVLALLTQPLSVKSRAECFALLHARGRSDLADQAAMAAGASPRTLRGSGAAGRRATGRTRGDSLAWSQGHGDKPGAFRPRRESDPNGRTGTHAPGVARRPENWAVRASAAQAARSRGSSDDRSTRFELLEAIGNGSFGIVYRARDTVLGRIVAIKVLHTTDNHKARSALQEARMAAALCHPNIVSLFDAYNGHGSLHLVMELVGGGALEDRIADGLTPATILDLARQVAAGLAHAHGAGIVHRDLKPANVLLLDCGLAKISDFGLARRATDGQLLNVSGTPRYMAPEQRMGDPAQPENDVYSFGATFLETATRRRPDDVTLRGESPVAALAGCPQLGRLRDVIVACLNTDPRARPRDGQALREALANVQLPTAEPASAADPDGVCAA